MLVAQAVKNILLVISALFPIVDPIGGAPVFLALTNGYTPQLRRLLARRIALNSLILMIASFTIGSHVLSFFGVSLPVVQVGGGLIVVATGWAMLNEKDEHHKPSVAPPINCDAAMHDAFYPLTMPLTVGPGSISIAITLGANQPHHLGTGLVALLSAAIGTTLIAASIYVCYAFSDRMSRLVGPSGMNVIVKLTAFLLVCIGVQILWNGASQLLTTVPVLHH